MNPLLELREAGQSVWLDFLRRGLITGGGLERLIEEDGLSGVTSNPSIFRKAISGSTDYDQPVRALAEKGTTDPRAIFYDLALEDIQMAANLFRPQFDDSKGARGFVSFELEAAIAHDTNASVAKAKELFARIDEHEEPRLPRRDVHRRAGRRRYREHRAGGHAQRLPRPRRRPAGRDHRTRRRRACDS